MEDEEIYSNVRQFIGKFIGKTVVDITQHDMMDWEEHRTSFVEILFDDGNYIRFYVGDDGFSYSETRINAA